MSYHLKKIQKGMLGEFSKIEEEFMELKDAVEQADKILITCELTYGAMGWFCFSQNLLIARVSSWRIY